MIEVPALMNERKGVVYVCKDPVNVVESSADIWKIKATDREHFTLR